MCISEVIRHHTFAQPIPVRNVYWEKRVNRPCVWSIFHCDGSRRIWRREANVLIRLGNPGEGDSRNVNARFAIRSILKLIAIQLAIVSSNDHFWKRPSALIVKLHRHKTRQTDVCCIKTTRKNKLHDIFTVFICFWLCVFVFKKKSYFYTVLTISFRFRQNYMQHIGKIISYKQNILFIYLFGVLRPFDAFKVISSSVS